jgi:lysophospholipase L1-like esterase
MKRNLLTPFLLVLSSLSWASPTRFDFGVSTNSTDRCFVEATETYSPKKGYGFEGNAPSLFSVALPEGNYRVTVHVGSAEKEADTTIKAESRRLMVFAAKTPKGETRDLSFIVNIRTPKLAPPPLNAPGGTQVDLNDREQGVYHWDDKLTLEFSGANPSVKGLDIEPAPSVPTVFLAGDSTVTDQGGEPAGEWGQMLPVFFSPDIAVANHAESGETLKSFITGHRLDKILEQMKAGDFLLIQFGHNDSKKQWPQTYVEPFTTYQAYLRVFIAEARRRGAIPILVTSMHRRTFSPEGKIINSHGDYPEAVRQLAKELGVPLIDLHAMSAVFYEALGKQRSSLAFMDATHHRNYGGYELAKCIVEGIKSSVPELAKHLKPGLQSFDPAKPDNPDTFSIPASPSRLVHPPRGS